MDAFSDSRFLWSSTNSGNILQKFLFRQLNASERAAHLRRTKSDALIDPTVGESSNMKDDKPSNTVRIDQTVQVKITFCVKRQVFKELRDDERQALSMNSNKRAARSSSKA